MKPAVQVNDKLILTISATRIVFIDIAKRGWVDSGWNVVSTIEWSNSTTWNTWNKGSGQWRVQRSGSQHMQCANVDIASRDRKIAWQLMFDTDYGLQRIRSLKVIRKLINRSGHRKLHQGFR